ncbi:MAG: hypothetical protein DRR08_06960 [Candidatus Parabeggiatoa sp. nov. 2]|nr:MAG: hypothetical protein B6247_13930 [Beggiatoa sp. 4572_84]RKZ62099.1 MAG: hypothetical protein DRR08_06960 [Gammaproteobacteria bacterium]
MVQSRYNETILLWLFESILFEGHKRLTSAKVSLRETFADVDAFKLNDGPHFAQQNNSFCVLLRRVDSPSLVHKFVINYLVSILTIISVSNGVAHIVMARFEQKFRPQPPEPVCNRFWNVLFGN